MSIPKPPPLPDIPPIPWARIREDYLENPSERRYTHLSKVYRIAEAEIRAKAKEEGWDEIELPSDRVLEDELRDLSYEILANPIDSKLAERTARYILAVCLQQGDMAKATKALELAGKHRDVQAWKQDVPTEEIDAAIKGATRRELEEQLRGLLIGHGMDAGGTRPEPTTPVGRGPSPTVIPPKGTH